MGSFTLTDEPGVLILGLAENTVRFDTRTGALILLADVEPDNPTTRVDDDHADRSGNYVFDTIYEGSPEPTGSLYWFTPVGMLQRVALPHVAIASSITFSPGGATLHWYDTRSRRIHTCGHNGQIGQVANVRVLVDLRDQDADGAHEDLPDGSAVDADGCLQNTERGGNRLTRYIPDERVLTRMPVPASQPTCLTSDGETLDTLYLMTACDGLPLHRSIENANVGATLQLAVTNVYGLSEDRFGHTYVAA